MRKKPMLAYPVSDKPIDYSNKISMQPKLDGVRCVIQAEWPNPMRIEIKLLRTHVQVKSGKI